MLIILAKLRKTHIINDMNSSKKTIKDWMKSSGKNRKWLADQCLVTITTVNDWFTSRGTIPAAKLELIRFLMEKAPSVAPKQELTPPPSPNGLDRITIEVEGELQLKINQKALELGMTTSCWASLALEEAAEEPDIMERIERRYAKKNTPNKESAAKLTATHQHLHAVEPEQHETA